MVAKFHKEDKIEAEAEVLAYLYILELQVGSKVYMKSNNCSFWLPFILCRKEFESYISFLSL